MLQACSIIIPHYNQERQLKRCLDALKNNGYLQNEVIVVDNKSNAPPKSITNSYGVMLLVTNESGSPYEARNIGIEYSTKETIILLDVNCEVTEGFIEKGLAILRSNMILCGIPIYRDKKLMTSWQKYDYLYSILREEDLSFRKSLPATNLFFKRSVFDEVGEFKEVRSLGDIAWTRKAFDSGIELSISEEIQYYYPFKDKKEFIKKYRRLGGGEVDTGKVKNLMFFVFKNVLPPSGQFIKRFQYLNKRENMDLNILQIIFLCWVVKIEYAIGSITLS